MKRIALITLLAIGLASASSCGNSTKPASDNNLNSLMEKLWNSSPYELSDERLCAMRDLQGMMDSVSNVDFRNYRMTGDPALRRELEKGNVLHFYQAAMDKLVKEIPGTVVEKGTVAIWHLYNMGYVVKTPSRCFAVDIMHPEAERLVPFIEFLAITHHHGDHYTDAMNKAMTDAGKPVYSNWDSDVCTLTNLSEIRELDLDGIHITTRITDHNDRLRNFVICYLIDCGEDTNHCTMYFVGDSCNAAQVSENVNADVFIPHLSVGLKYCEAAIGIQPQLTLVSHILEMGHDIHNTKWRWSYYLGLYACNQLEVDGFPAILPVWGDRFVFTPKR